MHQRAVEHAALLQIGQQGGDRLVPVVGEFAMLCFQLVVVVPGLARAAPDLHEAHASLEQPPGDQQLPAAGTLAPYSSRIASRLAADVERFGRFALHAIGQFERLDAGFELRVGRSGLLMPAVELLHEVELPPLVGRRAARVADVLDQLFDLGMLGVDVRPLISPRQERGPPVLRGHDRDSRRDTWR